jgi:hypothetical protein
MNEPVTNIDPRYGGMALVFEVKPTKILAFAKGTFSHTRYQF